MTDKKITDTKTTEKTQTEKSKESDSKDGESKDYIVDAPATSSETDANSTDLGDAAETSNDLGDVTIDGDEPINDIADAETPADDETAESTTPVDDERADHDADAPSRTEDKLAGDTDRAENPNDWDIDTDPSDLDGEEIAPASDWETRDPDSLDDVSPNGADAHDFSVRDTPEFVDPRESGIDSKLPEQSDGPGHAWKEYGVDKNPILTYENTERDDGSIVQEYSDGTQIWVIDDELGGMRENPETGELEFMDTQQAAEFIAENLDAVDVNDKELLDEIAADEAAPKTPLREAVDEREAQKQAEADKAAAEAANDSSGVSDPGPDGGETTVDVGELPPLSGESGSGDIDPVEHDTTGDDEGDPQFGQGDLTQPAGPDDGELGEPTGNTPAPDPIDYGPDHVDPSATGPYDSTGNPDFTTGTVEIDLDDEPTWMNERTYEMETPELGSATELDLID